MIKRKLKEEKERKLNKEYVPMLPVGRCAGQTSLLYV